MQFFSYLINGISLGSVYALIALGYTMVYGIAKMLNFAHGDVIMIGSYVVYFAFGASGLNPVLSIVLSMIVCTILGVVIERLAYRPLREAPSLAVLITAIGVSYLLQQVAQLSWSSNPKSFTSVVSGMKPVSLFGGQLTISAETIVTIVACVVIMVVLMWFVNYTPAGHAMLAVSEDRGAAQLMGVNVNGTISLTFAIGSAPLTPRCSPPPALCLVSRLSWRLFSAVSARSPAHSSAASCWASSRTSAKLTFLPSCLTPSSSWCWSSC